MADNVALVQAAYAAFADGDPDALLALMDPAIEWNMAEHIPFWPGGSFIGPDAVKTGVFVPLMMTFGPTFQVVPDRLVACGDTVVMQGRYKGVVLGNGNDLDAQACHVWDIKDGKIVRFQQYTDTFAYEEATELAPTF